jgi:hypothetical protein
MMECSTCPFGHSDRAEEAVNLGCVPSVYEIVSWKKDHNFNWGCHDAKEGEERLCGGFVNMCHEKGFTLDGKHLSYIDWFEHGIPDTKTTLLK